MVMPSVCIDTVRVNAADIHGIVTTNDGFSVAGAVVSIVSASAPSAARAPTRYCAPDCGRHTISSADGTFAIRGVASELSCTIHIEAKDCISRLLWTSPRAGQVLRVTLAATQSVPDQSRRQFAGQILRADGQPAKGAVISTQHPWTTSDREGKFFIVTDVPTARLAVTVDFEDVVKGQEFQLMPGRIGNTLQLLAGTTVSGRVHKNARPVEGVQLGLVERSPTATNVDAIYETTSDRDGRFTIEHVGPNRDFCLFTKMASVARQNLAAIKKDFRSGRDGQMTEVAEVNLHPAHRVCVRLVFSDEPEHTPDICVVLSRAGIPDSQEVDADEDGTFVFAGVPSESIVLAFQTVGLRWVHGYRLSPQHYSLDYLRRTALCGRVDEDLDLNVLLEPGPSPRAPYATTKTARKAANVAAAQRRMIIQQPNGARVIVQGPEANPLVERQRQLENEPLRGISAEVLSELHQRNR
jgi:hypothetical protein